MTTRPPQNAPATRHAWRRTVVLLAGVLQVPLLDAAIRRVTRRPVVEEMTVDGVPVEITRPAGSTPRPGFVFVTGAHPERRREPVVQRVAHGLARAGFVVAVPDLPGLGEGEIDEHTFAATCSVVAAVAARPDVHAGRIALAGASTGAALAIHAASRPHLADHISVVCSIVPFAEVREVVRVATTADQDTAGDTGHPVTALLRRSVGRSLVTSLPPSADRDRLLALLRGVADDDLDPLRQLTEAAVTAPDACALVALLTNTDPNRFDGLYEALSPTLRDALTRLSPLTVAAAVRAPVETIVPPRDPYFPIDEAIRLTRAHPHGRLTVTAVLDHTRPSLSFDRIGDLWRFLTWTSRCLGAAQR